jgi:AraC-like DNA-binding protein
MSISDSFSLSAGHALHVVELLKKRGIAPDRLLEKLGLSEPMLADPMARLGVDAIERLITDARSLAGEPGLGMVLGQQTRVTSFGYIGFAALSAPSLGDALELATQFAAVPSTALRLRLRLNAEAASLVVEERADLRSARDVLLTALTIGLWRVGCALTGRELDGSIDLAFPEPQYAGRFSHRLPSMRFGQPLNQIVFRRSILDLPIPTADPVGHTLARRHCERHVDAAADRTALVDRVRSLVAVPGGELRSLKDVSAALGLSPRSLKRKLAVQNASFSTLVEQQQRETAMLLLRSSEQTIEQIADKLGYSNVSNFVRAFRRWVGDTPAAYRRANPK